MKRIAFCFDGTWNTAELAYPTNVTRIAQSISRTDRDGITQIIHYDDGVGTGDNKRWTGWAYNKLAGAFGFGLVDNVVEAYKFLVLNYEPGDQLYVFGFSRGAFTARSSASAAARSTEKFFLQRPSCALRPRMSAAGQPFLPFSRRQLARPNHAVTANFRNFRKHVPFTFHQPYTQSMSFKRVETAADLVRYGASLKIECDACGAASTMSGVEVVDRCGPGDLERIRARLKCQRCGMKDSKLFVLPPV